MQELTCRICDCRESSSYGIYAPLLQKCINQHLRNFEKKQHMCPLCNKQIKTSRSVKPDLIVANLISALYPNRKKSEFEESIEDSKSLGRVIRDAAAKHMQQLKKMRESQMETMLRQYPRSESTSVGDHFFPEGTEIQHRISTRRQARRLNN